MSRLRLREVVIVEGKYDKAALEGLIDGLILTTDGYSIFTDTEKKELIRQLGARRGLLILTDSDAAGFSIRSYVEKIAGDCVVKHAYIPAVPGKESRKRTPSSEGTLGVEGLPPDTLRMALERANVAAAPEKQGERITYTHLYEAGLSGTAGSAEKRHRLLAKLGLPGRLSKRALRDVLNSLYTYEEFAMITQEKPVLFWDFHGTLTLHDVVWFDAAMEAAAELAPEHPLRREVLEEYFHGTCLPWFSLPHGDTRSVAGSKAWWTHCEANFEVMFAQCGFSPAQAQRLAPALRAKILRAENYTLYPDAISTLQELQRRGYTSYILSNNFPELEDVVTALGLRPYLQGVLVSGLVGYEKPRPEIFAAARTAAGGPAGVWMIGDNPRDDIEGGHAAGFTTVAVHARRPAPAADYVVENLSDILPLLP